MQNTVGEAIRQLRRQHSLTQTELGGERFSKSYVSAVEREKIVPSPEALRFFAVQLEQTHDYFIALAQESEQESRQLTAQGHEDVEELQMEIIALLDVLLQSTEQTATSLSIQPPTLSKEAVIAFPQEKQAEYIFLLGLFARQNHEIPKALAAFEQAIALAPHIQQPAILDEMGLSYYQIHEYETALLYHKRALNLLQETAIVAPTRALRIHMHCGNNYRVLGAYKQARTHYEQARQYLNSQHDIKTVAQLYLGLGYCTYAYVYQNTIPSDSAMPSTQSMTDEEMENDFQRALSFLIQSRTLYQTCNALIDESAVRLIQAMVILDLCTRRRQTAEKNGSTIGLNYNSYLNEAEEQCRQVLIGWQDSLTAYNPQVPQVEYILYTALAYLPRIAIQRAIAARLSGYNDTADRERFLAMHLCQYILDTLALPNISWDVVQNALKISGSSTMRHSLSLPRLPESVFTQKNTVTLSLGKLEVYYMAGEVMEELGRTATSPTYARDCYQRADYCFLKTLVRSETTMIDGEEDAGDGMRRYQRYIGILEERYRVVPIQAEETVKMLLNVLKDGLILHQNLASL